MKFCNGDAGRDFIVPSSLILRWYRFRRQIRVHMHSRSGRHRLLHKNLATSPEAFLQAIATIRR